MWHAKYGMQWSYSRGKNDGHVQPDGHVRQKSETLKRANLTQEKTDERKYDLGNNDWSQIISSSLKRLMSRDDSGRLTAQETVAVPTNGHLSESLAIGYDAEGHTKEELKALQEVGKDASPVTKETESDVALQKEGLSQSLRIRLRVAHSHSFALDIWASQVQ